MNPPDQPTPEVEPLPCGTGDVRAVMECPNMKHAGSTWDSDRYECKTCGKTYKTYDSEMQ